MQAAMFHPGWGQILLLLAVGLILLVGAQFPDLREGLKKGLEEFTREVAKGLHDAIEPGGPAPKRQAGQIPGPLSGVVLWIAQGFGAGRIPAAPGTFGSVVGVGWFVLLLSGGNGLIYVAGMVAGIWLSVWVCGAGELILKQKDPGSIVMDEIVAIPICFAGWVGILWFKTGFLPEPDFFFSRQAWPLTLAIFGLFRFFDIAKPWPVRQSQSLSGGWGVTVDDVLAAGYVNLVVLLVWGAQVLAAHP